MSRLISGEEACRVYSYLGLDRAPRRGFGIGVLAPGWDPMSSPIGVQSGDSFIPSMIPGCAAFYCTNTSAFPGAVGFPSVMPADWNMEAAGVGSWSAGGGCALSKQAGDLSGTGGTQVLRVTNTGWATCVPTVSTIGNMYDVDVWARGDGGTGVPRVRQGSGAVLWTGTSSVVPQHCVLTGVVANSASTPMLDNSGGAGTYAEFDDLRVTTSNSNSLSDLSGNGRHLVQATASSQPLWVASGSGGYLGTDGTADRMNVAYASNQPRTRYCLARVTVQASARTIFDGNAADSGALKHKAASTTTQCNAGSAFDGPALTDNTWHLVCQVLNGAASAISIDGGAFTTGDAGAGNPGGIYLGCGGGAAAGTFAVARYAAFADFAAVHDLATVQRMYRWAMRQKATMALT